MNRRWLPPVMSFAVALGVTSCKPAIFVQTPSFKYVKQNQGGCGDLFVYKGTADNLEVLWISAEKDKLKLPEKSSKTFDLAAAPDGLSVAVDLWDKAPRFSAYCNDISPDTKTTSTWRGKSGKVTITVHGPVDPAGPNPRQYKVSVRLENVLFEDDAGHQATLGSEEINDAVVGWYAG